MSEDAGATIEPKSDEPIGRRRMRTARAGIRWTIAIAVVLCVAIVSGLGFYLLSGAGGAKSLTAAYVPKASIAFLDVRTDLPGDQHEKLANFLAHFPGFKDRAQFDNAFDTMLNRLTGAVSQEFEYTSAFKPWAEGEISIAVTGVAFPIGLDVVAVVSVKDRAKAQAWISDTTAGQGYVAGSYAGNTIYTHSGSTATAYALTDKALLYGTPDAVKESLDAPKKGSLSGDANYQRAMKSFSGDRIASFYFATAPLLRGFFIPLADHGVSQDEVNFGIGALPAWFGGSIRVENDRIVAEIASPPVGSSPASSHSSRIAGQLPSSTVALLEIHSAGKLASQATSASKDTRAPGQLQSIASNVEQVLGLIGGTDWLQDVGLAVIEDGTDFHAGLVGQTADADTAGGKMSGISTLLAISSGLTGLGVSQENYNGTTITLVHVNANSLLGIPALDLALASKQNLILVGFDDAFVKSVLDTKSSNSLASVGNYTSAMQAAGQSNAGYLFLNLGGALDQLGPTLLSLDRAAYDLYTRPYLSHVGGASLVQLTSHPITSRLVVMAK